MTKKKRHRESIPVESIPTRSKPITLKSKNGKYGSAWKGVGKKWPKVGSGWKKGPHSKRDVPKTVTPFGNDWHSDKLAQTLPPTFKPYGPLVKKRPKNPKKKRKKKTKVRRKKK